MQEPLAVIIAAFVSSFLTLLGVFVQWLLSNITSEENQKREHAKRAGERLEEKYIQVIKTINSILREKRGKSSLSNNLSEASATIDLVSSASVKAAYEVLSLSFADFQGKIKDSKESKELHLYASEFKDEWNNLLNAKESLEMAMKNHLKALNFYHESQ